MPPWPGRCPGCQVHLLTVNCGRPEADFNSVVHGNDWWVGSVVRYSCRPGFLLLGDPASACQSDGHWTPKPSCLRECLCRIVPKLSLSRRAPGEQPVMALSLSPTLFLQGSACAAASRSASGTSPASAPRPAAARLTWEPSSTVAASRSPAVSPSCRAGPAGSSAVTPASATATCPAVSPGWHCPAEPHCSGEKVTAQNGLSLISSGSSR